MTPVVFDEPGSYSVAYRATDNAGNTSEPGSVAFTVVGDPDAPDPGECPQPDERATVVIGGVDSGVVNHALSNGCTINDLIDDAAEWRNHGSFVTHVNNVTNELLGQGVITGREHGQVIAAAAASGVGRPNRSLR